MDIISAAKSLKQQLVALDNSNSTISYLDGQLDTLGSQSIMSTINEDQCHHLRLLMRVSVIEGVRNMYQQYSNNKLKVQNTARTNKSALESDTQLTSSELTPHTEIPTTDKAAEEWTSIMCELSRTVSCHEFSAM